MNNVSIGVMNLVSRVALDICQLLTMPH